MMSYYIPFSDASKTQLQIEDGLINTSTSLEIAGRGSVSYGESIAKSFIHLLENFSNNTPPSDPIEGQLWYKSDGDSKQMHVWNGVEWIPSSGLWKSFVMPQNPFEGDVWVDTNQRRMYVYMGGDWVLMSSAQDSSEESGILPATLVGSDNVDYPVLKLNVNKKTVAIISNKSFTPKVFLPGYPIINSGITLSDLATNSFKFSGESEKAKSLLIDDVAIPASSFLRSDIIAVTENKIIIQSNEGLSIGDFANFNIGVDDHVFLRNQITGSDIMFQLNSDGVYNNVLSLNGAGKIGINNDTPEYELDVSGKIRASQGLFVETSTNSVSYDTGSIVTNGGIGVQQDAVIRGNAKISGNLGVSFVVANSNLSTIGSQDNPFNSIFSNNMYGTLEGTLVGNAQGNSTSSSRLVNKTLFSLTGDVITEEPVEFDGQSGGQVKNFVTQIGPDFIANKDNLDTLDITDRFLMHSMFDDDGNPTSRIANVTVGTLLSTIPKTPIASIMPFAGEVAPYGWLLCNGQQVVIREYSSLFSVIGYTYTPNDQYMPGFFKVPDMRGRFPLGMSNMGGTTIENSDANYAQELGAGGGNQSISLDASNIPDHYHSLSSPNKTFYTITDVGDNEDYIEVGTPWEDDAPYSHRKKLFIHNETGGISAPETSEISAMNPSLTLNYIIYTGKI